MTIEVLKPYGYVEDVGNVQPPNPLGNFVHPLPYMQVDTYTWLSVFSGRYGSFKNMDTNNAAYWEW